MKTVLETIQKIVLIFRQEQQKFFCPRTKKERKEEELAIKEAIARLNIKHKLVWFLAGGEWSILHLLSVNPRLTLYRKNSVE